MESGFKYLGFYTTEPMWVDKDPINEKLIKNSNKFSRELSKIVITQTDSNFNIEVSRDGLIMLQIVELEKLRLNQKKGKHPEIDEVVEFNSTYLSYINAFQFLLSSNANLVQKIVHFSNDSFSNLEVFLIKKIEDGIMYRRPVRGLGGRFFSGRDLSDYKGANIRLIRLDDRIGGRMVISKKTLRKTIKDFKKIFSEKDLLFILSQLNSSYYEFKKLNFKESLLISWFCIEYFINKTWINYLIKKKNIKKSHNRIDEKRAESLTGRDYTSAVQSNILEISDVVPLEIFKKINNVRKVRNDIVHNLNLVKGLVKELKDKKTNNKPIQVKFIDCLDCYDVLKYFMKHHYNMEIRTPNSFTLNQL